MRSLSLAAAFVFIAGYLYAQEYTVRQYKIENGLPSDLVKGIAQDSLGNLWIATDEGFVKYDASTFEVYRHVTHSNYTKGFYRTTNGRLLAFGDLDLFELKDSGDSIIFQSLYPVSRSVNDTTITYPKLLYEDRNGAIWISESQSVVKLSGGTTKRYSFELADRTPQFLRSFSFFEDNKGTLYTISVAGHLFFYDQQKDQFIADKLKFPTQIEYCTILNGTLVIGAADGLYTAEVLGDGGFSDPRKMASIASVSYVALLPDRRYFVATRGSEHFVVDSLFQNKRTILKDVNDINHVYVSSEKDIWLSTNEGIVLLQDAPFKGPFGKENIFIESIIEDPNTPLIYYASRDELHSFNRETNEDKMLLDGIPGGYFQSLILTKKGIWAANAFQVLLISNNKVLKSFDFSDQRMFVTSLSKDRDENVWLTIPGRPEILMIDNDLELHKFKISLNKDGFINNVKDGGDGIYAVSNGSNYLYYKPYADSVFQSISIPFNLNRGEELNTFNLFVKGQSIWLATSIGLLKYDHHKVERVNIEGYSGLPIRSLCANNGSGFLLATPKELLYYDVQSDDGNLFASSMNLSGLTVNARSILIDHEKKVWIGTSRGVFQSSRRIDDHVKTMQPRVAYAFADRKKLTHIEEEILPYNVLLSIEVTSVTFPEEERTFQFRRSSDQPWTHLNGTSVDIVTSQPGEQTIQVRARKTGPYEWSDITEISFVVAQPFWTTRWFYFIIAMSFVLAIALTVIIVRKLEAKQKVRLEAMVEKRTAQLGEANRELEAFSYSVSHDLRAPLRAILGFSSMLEEDMGTQLDATGKKNIDAIVRNANKMNQLIDDLLRLSRVLHQGLSKGPINHNDIIKEIVSGLRDAGYDNTTVNVQTLPLAIADRGLITQAWSNLISNAMKYSSKADKPTVDITYEEKPKEYIFRVKDNGAGFDMEYADKLFGVFQRLHSDREFPGIGIGLALVKRIIGRHDGRIWAEAKMGEGAAFYFSLPK